MPTGASFVNLIEICRVAHIRESRPERERERERECVAHIRDSRLESRRERAREREGERESLPSCPRAFVNFIDICERAKLIFRVRTTRLFSRLL